MRKARGETAHGKGGGGDAGGGLYRYEVIVILLVLVLVRLVRVDVWHPLQERLIQVVHIKLPLFIWAWREVTYVRVTRRCSHTEEAERGPEPPVTDMTYSQVRPIPYSQVNSESASVWR